MLVSTKSGDKGLDVLSMKWDANINNPWEAFWPTKRLQMHRSKIFGKTVALIAMLFFYVISATMSFNRWLQSFISVTSKRVNQVLSVKVRLTAWRLKIDARNLYTR